MKTLVRNYSIDAEVNVVFKALTDSSAIEMWSGKPAEMNAVEGGSFSLWDGSVYGVNESISKNKIVQKWFEADWDSPSKAIIHMKRENGKTIVNVVHYNVPDNAVDEVKEDWDLFYFGPIKRMVEKP